MKVGRVLIASLVVVAAPVSAAAQSSCIVEPSSVIGRSPSGVAQVSNLGLIHLRAHVPNRPLPRTGRLEGLKADVTVYQISGAGSRTIVPSRVIQSGGGGDASTEYAGFVLDIPVDPSERDAAIGEFLARLGPAPSDDRTRMARGAVAQMFRQHRTGLFRVECRVLDEARVVGVAGVDVEVVFKGRFFDQDQFRR